MAKKVLVNAITLSRIGLSAAFANYILMFSRAVFLITALFAVICATDFFDGILACKLSASSKAGAVFDVIADLFFIMTAYLALIASDAFPLGCRLLLSPEHLPDITLGATISSLHSRKACAGGHLALQPAAYCATSQHANAY